ncbi:pseudouridylate synthase RPUSD4, mitochondrial [Rhinophrynus dorsalis]
MAAPSNGATRGARRLAEKIRAEMRRMDKGTKDPPTIVHLRALQSRVVREDPDLVLINKPSGLSVHGGPSVSRSLASLLPALSQMLFGRGADPLRLCHRLDRDTTGALILARSKEAADRVQQQLRERSAHKVYW